MIAKKNLLIPLATLALLASCGNPGTNSSVTTSSEDQTSSASSSDSKPAPTPLADILANYRAGITATGTTKVFYGSDVHSTAEFITKFTTNSYHFEETTNGEKTASADLFKTIVDGAEYVATSNVTADNEVVLTTVRNEEGSLIGWSAVQNPFLDETTDPGFFDYSEEGYYYLDFSKDVQKRGNRYQAAIDLASKFAAITTYGFDSVKIAVNGNKITEISIVTQSFNLSQEKTTAHYEVSFTLDNDPKHDHSAVMATPYEHLAYHDTLKAAFDQLSTNPSYSFERNAASIASASMPNLKGYVSTDAFYYAIPTNADQFAGLILKENKVYEVLKDRDTYSYDETPLTDENDVLLHEIPAGYYPMRSEPVEAFIYSESSKKYVLNQIDLSGVSLADYFTFYFDTFGYILDEDSMSSLTFSSVEVELNSDNKISSIAMNTAEQGSVIYTFTYDNSALPFNPATLAAKDVAADMYGTYTGTFASDAAIHGGEAFSITFTHVANTDVYTKEKHPYNYQVTYSYGTDTSVYTAIGVSYSTTGGLMFTAGGRDYNLTKKEDGTYVLTVSDDSGKSASCVMTKQAA